MVVFVQHLQQRFGCLDALRRAGHLKFITAVANPYAEIAFDELEIRIERAT